MGAWYINKMLPLAVNTKIRGSCLAHHADNVWLFDTTRDSARSDRKVHVDPTKWTTARIRRMILDGKYITT